MMPGKHRFAEGAAGPTTRCLVPPARIELAPMNFSTLPSCRSTISCIAAKYLPIRRRSDSGSSSSPRLVKPLTSEKRIVTTFRASPRPGVAAGSGAAQEPQKRARSSFSAPQFAQISVFVATRRDCRRVVASRQGPSGARLVTMADATARTTSSSLTAAFAVGAVRAHRHVRLLSRRA